MPNKIVRKNIIGSINQMQKPIHQQMTGLLVVIKPWEVKRPSLGVREDQLELRPLLVNIIMRKRIICLQTFSYPSILTYA